MEAKVASVVSKLGDLWDIVTKESFNPSNQPKRWWRVLGL
jgi:hypothetical protein